MISVNGVAIDSEMVDCEAQYHPAPSRDEAVAQAARALVVRELLVQRARDIDLAPPAASEREETDEEALLGALIEREVAIPEPDNDACWRYYDNNRVRFRSPTLFEAAHILFPAAPDDAAARAEAKRLAEATIKDLDGDVSRFAVLARGRSACPSARDGGDLGQLTTGQTTSELETFMNEIVPGTICPVPVPTRFGYHVLYLKARSPGHELPYDAVREKIALYLRDNAWRRAVHQYIQILIGNAEIEGIALEGAKSPLVQ
ncbi:MAG: peptidylprolyl isomerase [Rhodospirillales bacterium]